LEGRLKNGNSISGIHCAKISNSFAEGINTKIVIQEMACGYKDYEYFRLKIIQQFNFKGIKSLING